MFQNVGLPYSEYSMKEISLTAYRACFILFLLVDGPKSIDEILRAFSSDKLLFKSCHKDTVTISINSLRASGFVIEKPKPSNNYKLKLISHPFKFEISQEQAELLYLIRNSLSYQSNYELLFKLNKIFDKITAIGNCKNCIDTIERSNYFKTINPDILNSILRLCKTKSNARIIYNSPINGVEELKIKAQKVVFENNRLYFWLYSYKYHAPAYLRIDKITAVKEENDIENENDKVSLTNFVKYELTGEAAKKFIPKDDEIVIEKYTDRIIVRANVINKFNFFQHIIPFSDNCRILEPDYIKSEFIDHIKSIVEVYNSAKQ